MDTPSIEEVLDHEGIHYRVRPGTSGNQVNVQECPECGSDNFKVYFNQQSGLGNCFRCDTKYSVFSFTKSLLKFSNKQTFDYFRGLSKGFLKRDRPAAGNTQVQGQDGLPESMPLPLNGSNLFYLYSRGITNETTRHFQLRYSQDGVYHYEHGDEQKLLDFSQTIIIPIHDISGKLITFQGRDITGKRTRKYLFPPGKSTSGSVLYNAHNAVGSQSIIIGEGVFDVFALHQALADKGIIPVATFGKHLAHRKTGDDQLSILLKLKRYGLDKVYFCWDGSDDASLAALKAMKLVHGLGFDTLFVRLPKDKDPNEVDANILTSCVDKAERYTSSLEVKIKLGQF